MRGRKRKSALTPNIENKIYKKCEGVDMMNPNNLEIIMNPLAEEMWKRREKNSKTLKFLNDTNFVNRKIEIVNNFLAKMPLFFKK